METKPVDISDQSLDIETIKAPVLKRDAHGRLLPGQQSLNPGGRSRDIRTAQAKLYKALEKVEKRKGKKFLEHYVEEAYKDRAMAIALLRKIIPDLKAIDVTTENRDVWNIVLQSFKREEDSVVE